MKRVIYSMDQAVELACCQFQNLQKLYNLNQLRHTHEKSCGGIVHTEIDLEFEKRRTINLEKEKENLEREKEIIELKIKLQSLGKIDTKTFKAVNKFLAVLEFRIVVQGPAEFVPRFNCVTDRIGHLPEVGIRRIISAFNVLNKEFKWPAGETLHHGMEKSHSHQSFVITATLASKFSESETDIIKFTWLRVCETNSEC